MTVRPIIFSAPMVQALLAGRKTQTRRLVPENIQDKYYEYDDFCRNVSVGIPTSREWEVEFFSERCRYRVGDLLYVREAWRAGYCTTIYDETLGRVPRPSDLKPESTAIEYLADDTFELGGDDRPSIHMPRWASRLTLSVTDVRVQLLNEISEKDALAEGMTFPEGMQWGCDPIDAFKSLWQSLHGPGSWDQNPWVVAISFTVHKVNVDSFAGTPSKELAS